MSCKLCPILQWQNMLGSQREGLGRWKQGSFTNSSTLILSDPGLQCDREKVLLCQWLCRFLLSWNLDGIVDLPASCCHFHLWPPHGHEPQDHGPFWWSQGAYHICAANRIGATLCTPCPGTLLILLGHFSCQHIFTNPAQCIKSCSFLLYLPLPSSCFSANIHHFIFCSLILF